MTILERFAEILTRLRPDDLADDERAILHHHLIDTVGASIAGARTADGRAVLRFDPAAMVGRRRRRAAADTLGTVAARVAATRSTEIDDIHMASCTTPGSVVIPTALTIARGRADVDGDSLGAAILAGYEAMTRLGCAIGGAAIVYRDIWPTYFCAPFAAAATVGRLVGLGRIEMAHALAIALATATGGAGRPRGAPAARWLLAGNAARNGAIAALAAAEGFVGDTALLDGDWLSATHGIRTAIEPFETLEAGDGRTVLRAMSLKPFCAAKQAVAAIHAMVEIIASGTRPETIESVRVLVPPAYAAMIGHGAAAGARLSAITSASHQLALAALHPDGLHDIARDQGMSLPAVAALASRIAVEPDETLARHWPAQYPARVVVKAAGSTRERLVLDAPGDPGLRFGQERVVAKFHRFTEGAPPPARHALLAAATGAFADGSGAATLCETYDAAFAPASG